MGIGYNFDDDQSQSKKKDEDQVPTQTHNKWRKKFSSIPGTREKTKKSYFMAKFVLQEKMYDFQFKKVFLITFSEWNGRAEVEENNSNGTIVCDDGAHKVILCTQSPFFCTRWVLLRSKKTILKI